MTIGPEWTHSRLETDQTTEISDARHYPQRRPREARSRANLSLGVGVRMTRSVEIAKAMAVAGFDWLFLDMEHGVMSLEGCAQIATAALDAGIAPIARVPNGEYSIATRALDNGALGIVMPHVDTAAEAREVVNKLKYPPVGHRSMGGIGPHYGLRFGQLRRGGGGAQRRQSDCGHAGDADRDRQCRRDRRSPGRRRAADRHQRSVRRDGHPRRFRQRTRRRGLPAMIAACKKHGKFPGMAGVYNEPIMPRYIEMGARFILVRPGRAFMMAGATQRTGFMRKIFGG